MRIEVVGEPFFELAMALVAGIGDGLKEFATAPRTTDVLGWAVALGCENAPDNDPAPVVHHELKSLGKSTIRWGYITRET